MKAPTFWNAKIQIQPLNLIQPSRGDPLTHRHRRHINRDVIYPFEGGRKDRTREGGRCHRLNWKTKFRLGVDFGQYILVWFAWKNNHSMEREFFNKGDRCQFHEPNERSRLYRVSTFDANKTNLNFARPDSQRISSRDRNNPSPTLSKRGRLDMQSG